MAKIDQNLTSIAGWLIEGKKPAQIILAACKPSPAGLGLSFRGCVWLIERAKKEISAAGVWDRAAQRGLAISQLREMHKLAKDSGDGRLALSARKELTKLMALDGADAVAEKSADGKATTAVSPSSDAEQEIELVRAHLLPLKLLKNTDALASELARVAVQRIIELAELKERRK